jgi:hypothetical protein
MRNTYYSHQIALCTLGLVAFQFIFSKNIQTNLSILTMKRARTGCNYTSVISIQDDFGFLIGILDKSLIYRRKKSGPRIEPYGTLC